MKRNYVAATLLVMSLGVSGCSSASAPVSTIADNSAEIESLKAQVQELEKENNELKQQLTTIAETTTAEETKAPQTGIPISI